MVRLFADSSSDCLSLLLKNDDRTLGAIRLSCGRRMSELIMGAIDSLLSKTGTGIGGVDEFYAVTGPGSFTGVRIGVAAILGLSAGSGKPCYGITSLDMAALASGLPRVETASRLKGDIFALRSYDFENNIFGPFRTEKIDDGYLKTCILVNTDGSFAVDLEKGISGDAFLCFRGECVPLYLRKSEAEINVDKKS